MSTEPTPMLSVPATSSSATLPSWYPDWARRLAEAYLSGTNCLFVLHGNVHDLIRSTSDGNEAYLNLPGFLATQMFGSWDVVLQYDLAKGLRPNAGENPARLQEMIKTLAVRMGSPEGWPRDPDNTLLLLDRMIERNIMESDPRQTRRIAVLLDYAQYLVPAGELGGMARSQGTNLVRLLSWAQNPYIKRVNMAICLIADKLNELNERLLNSPHTALIDISLPDSATREAFTSWLQSSGAIQLPEETPPRLIAEQSNGLSLINLNTALRQTAQSRTESPARRFAELKKSLIEQQCQGLVEFIEPGVTLDLLVGQEAAKTRLRTDAELIGRGDLGSAPMGYLVCGPVGTGKSFLAYCYAGSIGIPCLVLRNFRSKYVGETEGNLEQILRVLRSLGPVVVIVDEADAALGNRSADGDSGTSSRVFSMIASQMGDTRYRGKIIWMLLTSRPDLLPIDLKRQGRAEVHIPMFYPETEADIAAMFVSMARKNKVKLAADAIPPISPERRLSGADLESILLGARRRAITTGRQQVEKDDLAQVLSNFIPSSQGLEKELQELAAVLECTDTEFLTGQWREKVAAPNGRVHIQERMVAIRQLLE